MKLILINLNKFYNYEYDVFFNKIELFNNFYMVNNDIEKYDILECINKAIFDNEGVYISIIAKDNYVADIIKYNNNKSFINKSIFTINYNKYFENQYFEKIKDENNNNILSDKFDKYINYYGDKISFHTNKYFHHLV